MPVYTAGVRGAHGDACGKHDADGHVHIVGHEVRDVFFRAGRATGRAKTDNTPIGGPTRVLRVKVDPVEPWQ